MKLNSEKDRLAAQAMERWRDFEHGCRPKRKFPIREFRAFWSVAKQYAESTRSDKAISRDLATAVHELTIGQQYVRGAIDLENRSRHG
jgi:hypothetical protein